MHLKGFAPILLVLPVAIITLLSLTATIAKGHNQETRLFPETISRFIKVNKPPVTQKNEPGNPSSTPIPAPTDKPSPIQEYLAVAKEAPSPSPIPTPAPKPASSGGGNTTSGGNYIVATFNLSSITVVTDSANDDNCSNNCPAKSLAQFISENGGRAGINGTYFCPPDYSWCSGKVNTYDFPVWNNRKKKWMEAEKLFWDGRGMMIFRGGSPQFYPCAKCSNASSDITGGIVNYPSLLAGGQILVADSAKGTRNGIGFGNGKLFLVSARNSSYLDLANIFKSLGATDALNLDGGGSTALYDGGYRAGPGRALPNAIIVK